MKLILGVCFFLIYLIGETQTICNQTWEKQNGSPNASLDWNVSTYDSNKNLITAGNTQSSGNQGVNFLITKLNSTNGNIVWEKEWNNSSFDLDDYCTAICLNPNGIFVCGASTAQNGQTDIVVLKLDHSTGNVIWQYTYSSSDGLADVPTAIETSANTGVFVTGFVTKLLSKSDYLTFSLDQNSGNLLWENVYNYNNYFDAGACLTINAGRVYVTGASGTS